jgi:hypothetical protein
MSALFSLFERRFERLFAILEKNALARREAAAQRQPRG